MQLVSHQILADILGVSKTNIKQREKNGLLTSILDQSTGKKSFDLFQIADSNPEIRTLLETPHGYLNNIQKPKRAFKAIELFAGAGGLAIGLENAGITSVLHNEVDRDACLTLKKNRPHWNVVQNDIRQVDFSNYHNEIDLISGGFPCQAFSYAGNKLGFDDIRGTLFFEFARSVRETNPKVILAENVRGLSVHDHGRTLQTISDVIEELGYVLIEPKVLKAIFYRVPQKRERLFLLGIRKDLFHGISFHWPNSCSKIFTVKDALQAGELYNSDVPISGGQEYPETKRKIMEYVPEGGYWKDLPEKLQRQYMKGSFFLGGGKTGMARRLSWDEPSLTLTCAPAQKQTERCHPTETRPLTVREYARLQTFPDTWEFEGSLTSQYKQIGNAVPINLAHAMATSIVDLLNQME